MKELSNITLSNCTWLLYEAKSKLESEYQKLIEEFNNSICQEEKIQRREDLSGTFVELLGLIQETKRKIDKHNKCIREINEYIDAICDDAVKQMNEKGECEV